MDFVHAEVPGDVVASMNPDFIWKKGQSLASLVFTFGSHGGSPLGLDHLRKDQNCQDEHPPENGSKRNRAERFHYSSSKQILTTNSYSNGPTSEFQCPRRSPVKFSTGIFASCGYCPDWCRPDVLATHMLIHQTEEPLNLSKNQRTTSARCLSQFHALTGT